VSPEGRLARPEQGRHPVQATPPAKHHEPTRDPVAVAERSLGPTSRTVLSWRELSVDVPWNSEEMPFVSALRCVEVVELVAPKSRVALERARSLLAPRLIYAVRVLYVGFAACSMLRRLPRCVHARVQATTFPPLSHRCPSTNPGSSLYPGARHAERGPYPKKVIALTVAFHGGLSCKHGLAGESLMQILELGFFLLSLGGTIDDQQYDAATHIASRRCSSSPLSLSLPPMSCLL
ncbi:unnamed protein product, partial [Ectocarpus fasciculatus]